MTECSISTCSLKSGCSVSCQPYSYGLNMVKKGERLIKDERRKIIKVIEMIETLVGFAIGFVAGCIIVWIYHKNKAEEFDTNKVEHL